MNVLLGQEVYSYSYKGAGTTRYGLDLPYFTEVSLASKDPTSWSSTDVYALASFLLKQITILITDIIFLVVFVQTVLLVSIQITVGDNSGLSVDHGVSQKKLLWSLHKIGCRT